MRGRKQRGGKQGRQGNPENNWLRMEISARQPLPLLYAGDRFISNSGYGSTRRGKSPPKPESKDRSNHGGKLLNELQSIRSEYEKHAQSWLPEEHIKAKGIVIEIVMPAEQAPRTERFDKPKYGLELLKEKPVPGSSGSGIVSQIWFVPDGALTALEQVMAEYAGPLNKQGKVRHEALVNSIEQLRRAAFAELWSEDTPPPDGDTTIWLEAWLRAGRQHEREDIEHQFRTEAGRCGLTVGASRVRLPEHTIVAVRGTILAWSKSTALLNCVAEIRLGREYAPFFTELSPDWQAAFADDLRDRLTSEPEVKTGQDGRIALCVMDTGVNRAHPLIADRLPEARNQTIREHWSAADDYGQTGHGTPMAGLALYGDMTSALASQEPIRAPFVLEAVKIVPPGHDPNNEERLAAAFTQQGVSLVEAAAPHRRRIWCIATSMDEPCDGRPGSWSATLDMLAAGADDDGAPRRLLCLSAGNMEQAKWAEYPQANSNCSVQPPGQSWNALCIGSYTQLDALRTPGWDYPVAGRGCMAPTNTTSLTWHPRWPGKPDVVFEGGNAARMQTGQNTLEVEEMSLLSAAADFPVSPFMTMTGTSPATALAARFTAQLYAAYPRLWPETIRGLVVHSARWTTGMESMVNASSKKERTAKLLRSVGYGVPSLERAATCAASSATLIAEGVLQPFKSEGSDIKFNHMQVHEMPWPVDELLAEGGNPVRMRVTLSYFVEPNPGNRGYSSRYRYAGCQLRFRVSNAGQQKADLEADVSKIARDQFEGERIAGDWDGWQLDSNHVFNGSVHSNWWEGSAAGLAGMRWIAVYPITGWWKTRPSLGRQDSSIRYALLVTIEALNGGIDIYSPIAAIIDLPVEIQAS